MPLGSSTGVQTASPTSVLTANGPVYTAPVTQTTPNRDWSGPNNVKAPGDSLFATALFNPAAASSTYWMRGTGFGFSVPTNCVVTRVSVSLLCVQGLGTISSLLTTPNQARLAGLKLIVANVIQGDDLRSGVPGSGTPLPVAIKSYWEDAGTGVAMVVWDSDWGLALTPAVVNNAQFGCAVGFYNNAADDSIILLDFLQMTVEYTIPATVEKDVLIGASVSQTGASVQVRGSVSRNASQDVALGASVSFGITVVNPNPNTCPTITTAAMVIAWSLTAVAQNGFRVVIYDSNSGAGNVLYDSGFIGSSASTHTVPAGMLPSPASNLYLQLTVTDVNGVTTLSSLICFNTAFQTSVNVSNVTVRAWGDGCDDPTTLPGLRVQWSQVTPSGAETFIEYDVRRRRLGDTVWKSVATLTSRSTTFYIDHNVLSGQAYQYSVVWRATSGVSVLQSVDAAHSGKSEFEFNWLHAGSLQSNESSFVGARIESWEADKTLRQEVRFVQPWGRALPHAYVGQALGYRITVPLHPHALSDQTQWETLAELLRLQRDEGVTLCLRFGRAKEMYFGTLDALARGDSQKQFSSQIGFTETFWEGPS